MKYQSKTILVYDTNKSIFNYLRRKISNATFVYHSENFSYHSTDFILFLQIRGCSCIDFLNEKKTNIPVILPLRDKKNILLSAEEQLLGHLKFVDMSQTKHHFILQLERILEDFPMQC